VRRRHDEFLAWRVDFVAISETIIATETGETTAEIVIETEIEATEETTGVRVQNPSREIVIEVSKPSIQPRSHISPAVLILGRSRS
jgi:hypothetical protein